MAGDRQCVGRTRRSRPPLPLWRYDRRQIRALDGNASGGPLRHPQGPAVDRLQHQAQLHTRYFVQRRLGRRPRGTQPPQGQEDHRRRHRARAWRQVHRPERTHHIRRCGSGPRGGINSARQNAAFLFAKRKFRLATARHDRHVPAVAARFGNTAPCVAGNRGAHSRNCRRLSPGKACDRVRHIPASFDDHRVHCSHCTR